MARLTWADSHDGAECLADRMPGASDLAGWLPACPEDVWEALAVAERDAGGGVAWLSSTGPALAGVGIEGAHGAAVLIGHMAAAVHQHWRSLSAPRPPHPLALLVDAWQRLAPVEVEAETRADRRIMPVLQVVGSSPERERGMLFGGLVDDRPRVADLPLFPELEPTRYRVPLLEIVDATGVPLRSRGRGAPIEARLIVRGGLMMIRPEDRGRTTVRIAVTVGELLDGLYPTKRRIAQNWPKIEAALLTARDFTVPDATGGRWFPMALRRLPAERLDGAPPALDDLVVVDLGPAARSNYRPVSGPAGAGPDGGCRAARTGTHTSPPDR